MADGVQGQVELHWWGSLQTAYLIQVSDDMVHWTYVPMMYEGIEDVLGWGMSTTAPRMFLRIAWFPTDGNDPFTADNDGDGLSNWDEISVYSTNMFLQDSDEDGWDDLLEISAGLDPNDPNGGNSPEGDKDGDGLSNEIERTITDTSLTDPDFDDDGLSDGDEYHLYHTNLKSDDSDFDSLTDFAEVTVYHSNPLSWESDGDLMPDKWEVDHGLNPGSNAGVNGGAGDPDGDGLSNVDEWRCNSDPHDTDSDDDLLSDGVEFFLYFTSPAMTDTDNDGLTDWHEVNVDHTFPSLADSDFDGLLDGYEISTSLTNPLLADTDGDVMTDGWEWWYGLNPLSPLDANLDPDGDGYANLVEFYYTSWGYLPNTPGIPVNAPSIGGLSDDTDGDGLSRYNEMTTYHTNPNNYDTDGDWMDDGWEVSYGYNPLSASNQWSDTDGDGLPDCAEFVFGKNPAVNDTAGFDWNGDPDLDNLTTQQELTVYHTDPTQTDTDGDGLFDGWEVEAGFNPLLNNNRDANPRNDAAYDTDYDGLSNLEEAYYDTSGILPDTDGDGKRDDVELAQSSNPRKALSSQPAQGGTMSLSVEWGDPSGSHSEKYAVILTPSDSNAKTFTLRNAKFGRTETQTLTVPKGMSYTVTLNHVGTRGDYKGTPNPDYDYVLSISESSNNSPDCMLVVDDNQGILGNHTEEHTGVKQVTFFAQGKSATVTSLYLSSETAADMPTNRARTKVGVRERILLELLPDPAPYANFTIAGTAGDTLIVGGSGIQRRSVLIDASMTPCSPVVVATIGSRSIQKTFQVVKPNTIKLVKTDDSRNTNNPMKVDMDCDIYIQPEDVSFSHLRVIEGICAAQADGYFAGSGGDVHLPLQNVPIITLVPGVGWKTAGGDNIKGSAPTKPYSNGDFVWDIPWRYQFNGAEELFEKSPIRHLKTLRKKKGTKAVLQITKAGAKSKVTEP